MRAPALLAHVVQGPTTPVNTSFCLGLPVMHSLSFRVFESLYVASVFERYFCLIQVSRLTKMLLPCLLGGTFPSKSLPFLCLSFFPDAFKFFFTTLLKQFDYDVVYMAGVVFLMLGFLEILRSVRFYHI